jgi:hypothetical protein
VKVECSVTGAADNPKIPLEDAAGRIGLIASRPDPRSKPRRRPPQNVVQTMAAGIDAASTASICSAA